MQLLYYNNGLIFTAFDFSFSCCARTESHAGKTQGALCLFSTPLQSFLRGSQPDSEHLIQIPEIHISALQTTPRVNGVYLTEVPRLLAWSMLSISPGWCCASVAEWGATCTVGNAGQKDELELSPPLRPRIYAHEAGFIPANRTYLAEGTKLKAKLVQAPWRAKKVLTKNKFSWCLGWVTCRLAVSHQWIYRALGGTWLLIWVF